jgi:hypothetical protein
MSKNHSSAIFRVKQSMKIPGLLDPEDERTMID